MSDKTITLRPRLNEKTYGLADSRVYVFDVAGATNKHDIARAVEAQFEVKVTSVNTLNTRGKSKRVISLSGKRMQNTSGQRSDVKKAYVTLAEGHGLPFFEAIEEEIEKEQATQEKVDKAAAKQAAKDAKTSVKKATTKTAKTAKTVKATEEPAKSEKLSEAKQPAAPVQEPEKPHRSAWRGFRLRKKKAEDQ